MCCIFKIIYMFHWEHFSLRIYVPVYGLRLPVRLQRETYTLTMHREGKNYEIYF